MKLEIMAKSVNESFARSAVAAFALPLGPTLSELADIKTSVSEAVTNCIVHAYAKKSEEKKILIECTSRSYGEGYGGVIHIKITDFGCGIEDLDKAMTPFYTTLEDEERSGMGFTIMQTFADEMSVESEKGKGTTITLVKQIDGEGVRLEGSRSKMAIKIAEKEGLNA